MEVFRTCKYCGQSDVPHRQFVQGGYVRTPGRCRRCESAAQQARAKAHPFKGEYTSWRGMRQRCGNANANHYENYGGRGIQVCEDWSSFSAFLEDMGPKPSSHHQIDRIDNDGDYAPDNCRWATRKEQGANRSNTRLITFGGVTKPLRAWSRDLKIPCSTLHDRLRRGWSVQRAFTTRPKSSRAK